MSANPAAPANMSQLFVKLRHFYAITVAEIETDGGKMMFLSPCQQRFVGGTGQCTGNNIDLVRWCDAQTVFSFSPAG